ncbi:MAG: hypothetical protein ACYC1S_13250 [Gemmatimonadaceae bacterium]
MRVSVIAAVVALALPAGSPAFAQSGRVPTGSARPARTAAMPAPVERTPPGAAPASQEYDRRDDRERRHHREPRYIILGDGTVLADLGYGYEQVIRSCTGQRAASPGATGALNAAPNPAQHAAPNPNAQPVPNQAAPYKPPVYTPPVYTPPAYTPPVTTNGTSQGMAVCWTTDRNGQIAIVQP